MRRPQRPTRLIVACGVIELLSWGSLYYAVPILYDLIAADTGWSIISLTLIYSGALVVAALLGPRVGAYIDRAGPRGLVTAGAGVGVAGLGIAAGAQNIVLFALGILVTGVAQAATLYPPIFAALTIWFGQAKAKALTIVSVFGGASSAVFAPVLAPVAEVSNWRTALVLVAATYGCLTIPTAWWGLTGSWPGRSAAPTSATANRAGPARRRTDRLSRGRPALTESSNTRMSIRHRHRAITTSQRYRALQVSMMLTGLGLYGVTLNLIPLLRENGHSFGFAAYVFGLVGVGQIAGRLVYLPLGAYGSPRMRTGIQVGAAALTTGALGVVTGETSVVVAALAVGAVRGAHTLVMTIGISDRWGAEGFGALSGHFNRPVALAIAVSPFAGSALAYMTGSYSSAALLLGAIVACGLATATRAT